MESQDKEKEYEHNVWAIYRKEWETASPEKKTELSKRMHRWQELMKNGLSASQAYYKAMEDDLKREVIEVVSPESTHRSRWSWMFKATSAVLALAVVVAVIYGVVITKDRNALNTELESVRSVLASTQTQLTSTKQTLASTEAELGDTKQTLTSTQQSLASTQAELSSTNQKLSSVQSDLSSIKTKMDALDAKLKLYEDTMGIKIYSGVQPSYIKGGLGIWFRQINLTNNLIATNPTWQELTAFLLADPTDDEYYDETLFNCTNFAEMLHNNAEAAGIKTAFVAVGFENDPEGHALNAFKTTDKGLVYVDSTGGRVEEFNASLERDTIAYLTKGKELGYISLGQNTPLDYASYEKMNSYVQKLEAYNRDVEAYNAEQRRRAKLTPTERFIEDLEMARLPSRWVSWNVYMESKASNLKEQERVLDSLRAQLGSLLAKLEDLWEPMGIVESIEIYW